MTCENLFNKACEEKIQGHTEKAYELFSEVVNQFPGTDSAIYASEEMKELSVANTTEYSYIPSYIEDEIEKSDRLYEKACAEKAKGNLEKAYEIFAEIVNSYPGTVSAIYANGEMTGLSVANATEIKEIPSYVEDDVARCERILDSAYEKKARGKSERAYELFAEVVHDFPGTIFAIYANDEMMRLSTENAEYIHTLQRDK